MEKIFERKTIITMGEKINNVKIIDDGMAVEITSTPDFDNELDKMRLEETKGTKEYIEKYFPIVKASDLKNNDGLFRYIPETPNQECFKEMLTDALKKGVKDFRAQIMDPSFDEKGEIIYRQENLPAVNKSAIEWKKIAEDFMPEKNSSLGTCDQRLVFLALQIKYLVKKEDYSMNEAWRAICDQSKDFGNYWDAKDARHGFAKTGKRNIGRWCDLANTYKIILNDYEKKSFMQTGGDYTNCGYESPLANMYFLEADNKKLKDSTPWIVMEI